MFQKIKRVLKVVLLVLLGLIVISVLAITIFVNTAPQFGQAPQGADLERIKSSPLFLEGEFVNPQSTRMGSFKDLLGTLPKVFFGESQDPTSALPVKFGENMAPVVDSSASITWYGHSAFLFEIEGKRILMDPMLGPSTSPVPFMAKRFQYERPIPLEELTKIDAVILSHDHYDHLDYFTIMKLQEEIEHFFCPLGVGSHLKSWGISEDRITELDWWQEVKFKGLQLAACPARHFSGRGITDRNATLWSSWVINGQYQKLYFSGDGGYGPHFQEIGNRFGPFDLAMMECGQYNEAWKQIHMMPEESVQAGMDVGGKLLMPIHWGSFKLSVHEWKEPVNRFTIASKQLKIPMINPIIGERFFLGKDLPQTQWWESIK